VLLGSASRIAVSATFALFGPSLIDIMTASEDVRHGARDYLWFVVLSPMLAVFAFAFDGVYHRRDLGADMRKPDDAVAVAVSRRLAGAAVVRQCGTMGRADGALCRARRLAGVALSGAAARLISRASRAPAESGGSSHAIAICRLRDALGSGGRFNTCFHVAGARVNFLIDLRRIPSLPALKRLAIARDAIDLILITHFHGDQFGGLPFSAARCAIHPAGRVRW